MKIYVWPEQVKVKLQNLLNRPKFNVWTYSEYQSFREKTETYKLLV